MYTHLLLLSSLPPPTSTLREPSCTSLAPISIIAGAQQQKAIFNRGVDTSLHRFFRDRQHPHTSTNNTSTSLPHYYYFFSSQQHLFTTSTTTTTSPSSS